MFGQPQQLLRIGAAQRDTKTLVFSAEVFRAPGVPAQQRWLPPDFWLNRRVFQVPSGYVKIAIENSPVDL